MVADAIIEIAALGKGRFKLGKGLRGYVQKFILPAALYEPH